MKSSSFEQNVIIHTRVGEGVKLTCSSGGLAGSIEIEGILVCL